MALVGWALIAFGLVFLALGVMAALNEVKERKSLNENAGSVLKDLTEFIKALATLPKSAMFTILGLLMIAGGGLVVNDPKLSFLQAEPAKPVAAPAKPAAPPK
jgi:uncharacterized membrane protein HdeD (DUF308 family)